MVDPRDYDHVIHVDPSNSDSVNNVSCYDQSKQTPCKDINFALAFPNRGQSTIFVLSPAATHNLTNNAFITVFSESSSVAFHGDNGTAVVECMDGAGLAFLNSTNITFNGVSFQKCGAWRDSTSRDFSSNSFQLVRIRVGLYFYNCRDVTMVNMSVLNSTEAVGVVMYSTAGVNYIAHSQFDSNRISESNKNESGGGGFAVEFNYCKPGDNSCNETNYQTENNKNTVYTFEHCSFSNNRAVDQSGKSKTGVSILPINQTHSSLGRGGGLSVYFKAAAFSNHVRIHNCTFHRNHANWGGGLCVQYADHSIQNQVLVTESSFITNHCYFRHEQSGTVGGGVLVSSPVHYDFKQNDTILRNNITFDDCIFTNNRALTGGALAFVYTLQRFSHHKQLFHAIVSNSTFSNNLARLGSAVAVDHEYFYHEGELGDMLLADCIFSSNTIVYNDTTKPYSVGVGALYISEVHVTFQRLMEFQNNTGSALALVGTRITFDANSTITFTGNGGADGGAISLLGCSSMLIGEGVQLLFEENTARRYGGAIFNIYVGREDLRSAVKCFIQYDDPFKEPKDWNARIVFHGNTAGHLGNSIFSSTILPCSWSEDLQAGPNTIEDIFCWNTSTWIYKNSNCSNEIYTSPQNFTNISSIKAYPGNRFQLNTTAFDDLGHDVSSNTIYTALIKNTSETAEVDPQYSYVANGSIAITGEEERNVILQLDVATYRDWRIEIPVYLNKCPLGFKAQTNGTVAEASCECIGGKEAVTFGGRLLCEKATLLSKIRNGFWIGQVPKHFNNTFVMGSTRSLLQNTKENYLNLSKSDVDSQCSHLNRKGPLCGECIEDYSTAVNSYTYKCVLCTSNTTNLAANIAAYVALTYLPYLIVFIAIIYFDVRLMSGPLVGFILYAQLIGSGVVDLTVGRLPYSHHDSPAVVQTAYRLVFGVFNLNSFSKVMNPFCINEHFNALDVICLDYGIAILPLLLILVIHLLIRLRSYRLRQKRREKTRNPTSTAATEQTTNTKRTARNSRSLIHAFVGFIYLSYLKLSVSSTLLLTTTAVIRQDGSHIHSPRLVYYAGQYTFNDIHYFLPYGLIGIIVFVFVGICLPLLLLGPLDLINWLLDKPKCECLRRVWPSVRVNIFLEAFRNCYKPERRYFAGIYFLFRLIMLMLFAFSSSPLSQVLWQLMFIILMMLLVAIFQPHKKTLHNYVDILALLNMAGIAVISVHLYTSPSQLLDDVYPVDAYIGGLVLVWLPIFYFLLYLLWLVLRKTTFYIERINPILRRISPLLSTEIEPERQPLLNPVARGRTKAEKDEHDLFQRAQDLNQYKPARTVNTTVVDVHGTSGTASVRPGTNNTSGTASVRPGTSNTSDSSGIESNNTGSSNRSYDY